MTAGSRRRRSLFCPNPRTLLVRAAEIAHFPFVNRPPGGHTGQAHFGAEMRGQLNSFALVKARSLRAPIESLEQRFLLSVAVERTMAELKLMGPLAQAPAVTDIKNGPLAKLGALLPL